MTLHRYVLLTLAVTYLLLLVGGLVNPTGSSLACPDWPLCHGELFPAMKDGVEYEHSHRLLATAVGLLTLGLAAFVWRKRSDPAERRLGLAAVALVVVQGVLGGVTVLLQLPLAISTAHLGISLLFFLLLLYLAFRLRPGTPAPEPAEPPRRGVAGLATVAIYGQVLLGALVRHTRSGRVCGTDYLLCNGELWPGFGPQQLHMLHRFGGLIVFAVVLVASLMAAAEARRQGRRLARGLALALPGLLALQVLLGVETVRSSIGLAQVTAHLGLGALLVGTAASLYMALGPLGAPRAPAPETPEATTTA